MLSIFSFDKHVVRVRYLLRTGLWLLLVLFLSQSVVYAQNDETKKAVRSFDVFDTLVGRIRKDPHSTFFLVEASYPFPGFAEKRVQAELSSNGTLDDIYRQFMLLTGISEAEAWKLRDFEFQTELSNVFPIRSMLSKVQDGDILVSDCYYNEEEILMLLRHVGLEKEVKIFASVRGKSDGWIWPVILGSYTILEHIGDNLHSDVYSPQRYGIQAERFELSEYSPLEADLSGLQQEELAKIMRVLRLSNPYPEGSKEAGIWWEQAEFNVPILILSSYFLEELCRRENAQTILFSQRDCYHWIKIFKKLFPSYHCVDFMTSRRAYNNPSPEYIEYVANLCQEQFVIADANGTGETCVDFFNQYFLMKPVHLAIVRRGDLCPGITYAYATYIEMLNYAPYGSLQTLTEEGPVRFHPEYPLELISPASKCIDRATKLFKSFHFQGFDQRAIELLMAILMQQNPVMMPYHTDLHGNIPLCSG